MGCDIHVWIEKRRLDGSWAMFREFDTWAFDDTMVNEDGEPLHPPAEYIPYSVQCAIYREVRARNYPRFALLAGARGEGPAAKGWPDDTSPRLFKVGMDDCDLHSHSWYSLAEAAQIWVDTMWEADPARGLALANPAAFIFGIADDLDQYRVLFAFDN